LNKKTSTEKSLKMAVGPQRSAWPIAVALMLLAVYLRDAGILGQKGRNRKSVSIDVPSVIPSSSGVTVTMDGAAQPILISAHSATRVLSFSYCNS
jgi:hypothetical protein